MIFSFKGECILELEYEKGMTQSKHYSTKVHLSVSDNLSEDAYIDDEGLPNKDGIKALTNVFIQGLIANIHVAQDRDYWKDHEHIKYIISELERGFVNIAQIGTSEWKDLASPPNKIINKNKSNEQ
jgi:hypothetical protein